MSAARPDIHKVCRDGDLPALSNYLDQGGNYELKDNEGRTPLHWACIGEHEECAKQLLDAGADVMAKNSSLRTPLHLACFSNSRPLVRLLLQYGAVQSKNREGQLPMQEATDVRVRAMMAGAWVGRSPGDSGLSSPGAGPRRGSTGDVSADGSRTPQDSPRKCQGCMDLSSARARWAARERELTQANARKDEEIRRLTARVAALEAQQQASTPPPPLPPRTIGRSDSGNSTGGGSLQAKEGGYPPNASPHMWSQEPRVFNRQELQQACQVYSFASLGEGAFGTVYRGRFLHPGESADDDGNQPEGQRSVPAYRSRDVAVKMLNNAATAAVAGDAFKREVMVLKACLHENLVPLLGICIDPMCLVYPLMSNGSLDKHITDSTKLGLLSWTIRCHVLVGVCRALRYLHTPLGNKPAVIHRDVKPANILLDQDMNPRLSDVGISRVLDPGLRHATTGVAGTPVYLDPVYLETFVLTEQSDKYSLGVVVLELLTGKLASVGFVGRLRPLLAGGAAAKGGAGALVPPRDPSIQWPAGVPEHLASLANACLCMDPNKRPDLGTAIEELQRLPGAELPEVKGPGMGPPPHRGGSGPRPPLPDRPKDFKRADSGAVAKQEAAQASRESPRQVSPGGGHKSGECALCMDEHAAFAFRPCGHACVCLGCYGSLHGRALAGSTEEGLTGKALRCPVCDKLVDSLQPSF